jgi:hypothetical protein
MVLSAAVVGRAEARSPSVEGARFRVERIDPRSGIYTDCSDSGPRLRPGDRFAVLDERGWHGEVTIAADRSVFADHYDGCANAQFWSLTISRSSGRPGNQPAMLVGPLLPGETLRRARMTQSSRFRGLAAAFDRDHVPPPDFIALFEVDLDGNGTTDAEQGVLACDTGRWKRDGDIRRVLLSATRRRVGAAWRYTFVADKTAPLAEWPSWPAQLPYAFCPFEPPAPEDEVGVAADHAPAPRPVVEGLVTR